MGPKGERKSAPSPDGNGRGRGRGTTHDRESDEGCWGEVDDLEALGLGEVEFF